MENETLDLQNQIPPRRKFEDTGWEGFEGLTALGICRMAQGTSLRLRHYETEDIDQEPEE